MNNGKGGAKDGGKGHGKDDGKVGNVGGKGIDSFISGSHDSKSHGGDDWDKRKGGKKW